MRRDSMKGVDRVSFGEKARWGYQKTRDLLEILSYNAEITLKGTPAPAQVGQR